MPGHLRLQARCLRKLLRELHGAYFVSSSARTAGKISPTTHCYFRPTALRRSRLSIRSKSRPSFGFAKINIFASGNPAVYLAKQHAAAPDRLLLRFGSDLECVELVRVEHMADAEREHFVLDLVELEEAKSPPPGCRAGSKASPEGSCSSTTHRACARRSPAGGPSWLEMPSWEPQSLR